MWSIWTNIWLKKHDNVYNFQFLFDRIVGKEGICYLYEDTYFIVNHNTTRRWQSKRGCHTINSVS